MGMAVLLTALVAAAGTAVGVATGTNVGEATDTASSQAETIGLVGGIVLLFILFVAHFCGGYVAGRMARFDGLKQGLAVWLWALVVALVVAALVAIAGNEYNVLGSSTASRACPWTRATSPRVVSSPSWRSLPPALSALFWVVWQGCGSIARWTGPDSRTEELKGEAVGVLDTRPPFA